MKKAKDSEAVYAYVSEPRIEISGCRECLIDGLKSISEYTEDKIKIDLGKYSVCIVGDGLCINSFSSEGAVVEGTVMTVEFEGNA